MSADQDGSPQENPKLTDCPDCGHRVSRRAATCPGCGAPLDAETEPQPQAAPEPEPEPQPKPEPPGQAPPQPKALDEALDPAPSSAGEAGTSKAGLFILIGVVLLLIGLTYAGVFDKDPNAPKSQADAGQASSAPAPEPPKAEDKDESLQAYYMAMGFVKRKLVSPSTAEFPSDSDVVIKRLGQRDYQVVGWVDSQNKFGAMVRSEYICTMEFQPDKEQWMLKELVFKGR